MKKLDGFHLQLFYVVGEIPLCHEVFNAELRAIFQSLSLNESGGFKWGRP